MLTLLLFCAPTLLYVIARTRRGDDRQAAIEDAGARPGTAREYGRAVALVPVIALVVWGSYALLPDGLVGGSVGAVLSPRAIVLLLARVAGEEILFRGLLGGILVRRLGVGPGTVAQAVVSIIPTLGVLAIDARLWPVPAGQLVIAWLLGLLRTRSGTCFPGIVSRGAGQILGGLLAVV